MYYPSLKRAHARTRLALEEAVGGLGHVGGVQSVVVEAVVVPRLHHVHEPERERESESGREKERERVSERL